MGYQVGILEALKDWGLVVVEVDGWKTRGSSDFNPRGHVFHHDVVPDHPGTNDPIPDIIVRGRSDLPGPLANFWLETDGNVHLCAAGRANHAGEGGWKGLSGNSSVFGTEMNNLGTPDDEWPEVQIEAATRLAAATCEFSGFEAYYVCGHKEWTTRKIDPHTIDMDAFRTQVRMAEKESTLSAQDVETLRRSFARQSELTRETIRNQHAKDRAQQAKLAKDDYAEKAAKAEVDDSEKAIARLKSEKD